MPTGASSSGLDRSNLAVDVMKLSPGAGSVVGIAQRSKERECSVEARRRGMAIR
jgi:hypothetical protein